MTLPSVITAESLVAMYISQLANWRTSPAGNVIERHTLVWLAAKFGLPGDTIATFTSGGTEANLSAVVVAARVMRFRNMASTVFAAYQRLRLFMSQASRTTRSTRSRT